MYNFFLSIYTTLLPLYFFSLDFKDVLKWLFSLNFTLRAAVFRTGEEIFPVYFLTCSDADKITHSSTNIQVHQ